MKSRVKVPFVHILMFILTFFSILLAGALHSGADFISHPCRIWEGLPFALSLMFILLAHELAHYFASHRHGVRATLPFFIPAPPPIIFGTFGAFIKMKSPIRSRTALVDIGASGPIAGFVMSLVAVVVGLNLSSVIPVENIDGGIFLGDSLIFSVLSGIIVGPVPEGHDVLLHPVAFAGWIGFFVTFLNLIPVGQLDGGHIMFAMMGRRHRSLSLVLVGVLALLGAFVWPGWLMWALLLMFIGTEHPPVLNGHSGLDTKRWLLGIACLLIFVLTFTPVPLSMGTGSW